MPQLPNRLRSWKAFLDWYARDAGYWYFPKGRVVQSDDIPAAFKVLRKFEGKVWRDAQSGYLRELKKQGLFNPRGKKQSEGDATAMARMWKTVFSTLGLAWVEDDYKVSITSAGQFFLAANDPVSIIEKQMQRYQFKNPGVRIKEQAEFEIRPHIFLLEVLLNADEYITHDEYVLFVSRSRTHDELGYILDLIEEWRSLDDADRERIKSAASKVHSLGGRRTSLVNTIELNKSYALQYLTFAGYLEKPESKSVAAELKTSRRRSVESIVRKFTSKGVFIDFHSVEDWFAYYGDIERFPSQKEAASYYVETSQTEKLAKNEFEKSTVDAQISEKILEDVLERNLHLLKEGLILYGRQYPTITGRIDLLCKDTKDDFVVIELKKGRATDPVVGQTLRYMGYVRSEMLERRNQKVRGIILSRRTDNKLKMAIAGMGAKSTAIKTKTFNVSITVGD